MVFKKGNKYTFKVGSIPSNKKRNSVKTVKSDSDTSSYIRLTKQKHNLVVNDPFADPEEKSERACRAARLLRPMSDEASSPKQYKKKAVKDKR